MHRKPLFRGRRPSAPMVVALLALFSSLGGVGWAATQLPAGSVGSAQLRTFAVTNPKIASGAVGNHKLAFAAVGRRKIQDRAVGLAAIDTGQVQARVSGACSGGRAITAITSTGGASCVSVSASPREFGAGASHITIAKGTAATKITSKTLPAGSAYLDLGVVSADVTGLAGTGQSVAITCTLSPGGAGSPQTATATVLASSATQSVLIPINVPTNAAVGNTTASISCTQTPSAGASPTVTAAATLNALTTAGNS